MKSDFHRNRTYNTEIMANMVSQILKEYGIDSFVSKDDSGSMRPHLQRVLGVELFVRNEDVEKAEEILENYK